MSAEVDTIATAADTFIGHFGQSRKPWWVRDNADGRWVEADTITNPDDMLRLSRTDWDVELAPLFARLPDGTTVNVPTHFATTRKDNRKVLGVVGDRYTPFQNRELAVAAFEVCQAGALFVAGMSLQGGKHVCYVLKPHKDTFRIAGQTWDHYMLATGAHDGTGSVQLLPTPVCVECSNTHSLALRTAKSRFTMRHTKGTTPERLHEQAVKALQISDAYLDEFAKIAERLADVDVTVKDVDTFLGELFPIEKDAPKRAVTIAENKRDKVREAYGSKLYAPVHGTGWGFVQAVNDFEQWGNSIRGDRADYQALAAVSRREPLAAKARELILA